MRTTILTCNPWSVFARETPPHYAQASHLAQWDAHLASGIGLYIIIINSVSFKWRKTNKQTKSLSLFLNNYGNDENLKLDLANVFS